MFNSFSHVVKKKITTNLRYNRKIWHKLDFHEIYFNHLVVNSIKIMLLKTKKSMQSL